MRPLQESLGHDQLGGDRGADTSESPEEELENITITGLLEYPTEAAATRPQASGRQWMDGWMDGSW